MGLCLEAVEVKGSARWRWILTNEESGIFLAEHHVQLDESDWEYRALADLHGYLPRDRRVSGFGSCAVACAGCLV